MWQDDTVTIQTKSVTPNYGGGLVSWGAPTTAITCDVQDINKEIVFKNYGFTENVEYKQVFDLTKSALWIKGNQVLYDGDSWIVRLVNRQMDKIGSSNHVFVILSKVA